MAGILFITDIFSVGGSRTYLQNVVQKLKEKKHEVSIIGFVDNPDIDFHRDISFSLTTKLVLRSFNLVSIPIRIWKLYRALCSQPRSYSPDLIIIDLALPAFAFLVARPFLSKSMRNCRVIYQFHGLGHQEAKSRIPSTTSRVIRMKLSLRSTIEFFIDWLVLNKLPHTIIVFSNYAHRLLMEFRVRPKVQISSPGPDQKLLDAVSDVSKNQARKKLGLNFSIKIVLIASRLEPRKGVLSFFANSSLMQSFDDDVIFIIAGDFASDPYAQNLFWLLKKLDAGILLVNDPSRTRLAFLYKAADVVVVPSTDLETFGFVTLEALGVGTPVIAYDIGANRELMLPEVLSDPKYPHTLTKKIKAVLALAPEERRKLVNQMRQTSLLYSWNNYVNNLLSLIG